MISRVLAVMYGEEYDMPKKSGAFEVFKILQESGYVEAANLFKNIKSKQTDKYYLNKREFLFFEDQLNIADMKDMAKAYNKIQLEE